ncbi:MAG: outer membrane beta-barrel protein [Candidatus Aminicenantes bacterium]|nr:outer membrane beta-barrel protein [Candidatus Aminicenantes bacterium]
MRKHVITLLLSFVMIGGTVEASDLFKKFHITVKPTGLLALSGYYNDSTKLREAVNPGLGFGVGFRYELSNNVYLDFGYSYNWLSVKEDYRLFDYQHQMPAFEMQNFVLNGNFYLKSGYFIEPYLTLGGGISYWKFSQDTFGSGVWPAPGNSEESFSDISPLLNIGLGVEVFAFKLFSIVCEVKYNYLFSRNPAKFKTDDFTQQDYLTLHLGVVFRFGK